MKLRIALVALLVISLMTVGCITIESSDSDDDFDSGSEVSTSGSSGTTTTSDKRDIANLDFNTYIDPTYYISVGYPIMYSYEQNDLSVVFTSDSSYMYYVLEVLLTSNKGGTYSSLEDVQADYLSNLRSYGAELLGSASGQIDGYDALDFAISYTIDGDEYINRYIVGTEGTYFYVLQIIAPSNEYNYEIDMIDLIIASFVFGDDGSRSTSDNYGTTFDSGASTSTSEGTSISGISPEECYEEFRQTIEDTRWHNEQQDPSIETGGIWVKWIGTIDECYDGMQYCFEVAEEASDECWAADLVENEVCMEEQNIEDIQCAQAEVDCTEFFYREQCGLPDE